MFKFWCRVYLSGFGLQITFWVEVQLLGLDIWADL